MNIKLDRKELAHLLDRSADQLEHGTLDELRASRLQALQHQRVAPSIRMSRDGALFGHLPLSRRALSWVVAAIAATVLLANLAFQQQSHEHNHGNIDIAILTDDLPVDIYVD
jgi:type VI protein secretion system component VasF